MLSISYDRREDPYTWRIPVGLSVLRTRLPVLRNSLLWTAGCGGWIGTLRRSRPVGRGRWELQSWYRYSLFCVISPLQRSFKYHRMCFHHGPILRVFEVKNQGFPDCLSIRDCIIVGRVPMSWYIRRAKSKFLQPGLITNWCSRKKSINRPGGNERGPGELGPFSFIFKWRLQDSLSCPTKSL